MCWESRPEYRRAVPVQNLTGRPKEVGDRLPTTWMCRGVRVHVCTRALPRKSRNPKMPRDLRFPISDCHNS